VRGGIAFGEANGEKGRSDMVCRRGGVHEAIAAECCYVVALSASRANPIELVSADYARDAPKMSLWCVVCSSVHG
jgi:hypothetical protein